MWLWTTNDTAQHFIGFRHDMPSTRPKTSDHMDVTRRGTA
jgi:hypothetical protein